MGGLGLTYKKGTRMVPTGIIYNILERNSLVRGCFGFVKI